MKKEKQLEEKQAKQDYCVIHWLGGTVKLIGSMTECRKWAKRNNYSEKHPIYLTLPIAGVVIHNHKHEHTHIEKSHIKRRPPNVPST